MSILFPAAAAARLEDRQQREARQNEPHQQQRARPMRVMLGAFPLFVIPVGIYAMIAFLNHR